MDVFILAISSVAIGLLVGVLSGLLGIGGGTILVPVFKLLFGLPAAVSTATSLFTIIPTSLSGAVTHLREKTCIPLLGVAAGLGGACTSSLGVWLASISPEWAIMAAAALVIGYSAVTMFMKAMKLRKSVAGNKTGTPGSVAINKSIARSELAASNERTALDRQGADNEHVPVDNQATSSEPATISTHAISDYGEQTASQAEPENEDPKPSKGKMAGFGFLVGAIAGVMSGYVGVGGGFLMVPMFMQLLNAPMKKISGTSLIAVMILAIPGTITNAVMGNVDWIAGIFVAIGAIPGATIGSRFISRVPEFQLRLLFSCFLIVAAVLLVINQLNIF